MRYSPALVLVLIVIADAGRFADPDLWRHIVVGRAILASHKIQFGDPYTYSVPGHFWRNHSWLAEAIGAIFYDAGGVIGLNVMKLGCTAILVLFLTLAMAETGASTLLQFVVMMVTAVALGPFLQFRPQLYTYSLFAVLLWLLTLHNFRGKAMLWTTIPLMALWANLHGGFVVGIAALGLYATVSLGQDLWFNRGWRRGMLLGLITVAAALGTLATPYGLGSWYTVAHSVLSPEARGAISEWRPMLVEMIAQWHEARATLLFYALTLSLIASLTVVFVAAPRADDLPLVAIASMMIAGAFSAVRNVPLALIAIAVPLVRHAGLIVAQRFSATDEFAEQRAKLGNQIILSAIAAIILISTGFFSPRLPTTIPYPDGALAFMDSHSLHGNILNDVNWGGYLLWRAPDSRIFIDGRFETLYPAALIRKYLLFQVGVDESVRLLDEYPHDFVLMPPDSGAAHLVATRRDWLLVYQDRTAALFVRANSPAARIEPVLVASEPPPSYFP